MAIILVGGLCLIELTLRVIGSLACKGSLKIVPKNAINSKDMP